MKWILHDQNDGNFSKLLENCYKAQPEDGKVIVVEFILLDKLDSSTSMTCTSQVDLIMMTQNLGEK